MTNTYNEPGSPGAIALGRLPWGAIFAGVIITVVVQLLFTLLGAAIGAATVEPLEQSQPGKGLGIGAAVWLLIGSLIAMFMFAIGESRVLSYQVPSGLILDAAGATLIGWDLMIPGLSFYGAGISSYPARHGKNYNQLCCDGHVEAMAPSILFNVTNTASRWNNDHQPHFETWPTL